MGKGKHSTRRKKALAIARSKVIHGLTLEQVENLISYLKKAATAVVNKDDPIRGPAYQKEHALWVKRRHDHLDQGKEVTHGQKS